MTTIALLLVALPAILIGYALIIYPALLLLMVRLRPARVATEIVEWPMITITVPAYNEAASIGATLDRLLALDYPAERLQILVISDASTDGTDEIVRGYESRGVELLRLPRRMGKTGAENAAAATARGDIIVNIDASVQVARNALKPLVAEFADPTVGVASGRDVSVGATAVEENAGEAGYVGYEMWVRDLETSVHSIIGASGCFFATRRSLFAEQFPESLSRDFASALIAREHGFRSVSVRSAVCSVPRTRSLRAEFTRKVRTMTRGLATLEHKRALLDPERYGVFAWMLVSHKLCRWLFYPALPFAAAGLLVLATSNSVALWILLAGAVATVFGMLTLRWPAGWNLPRPAAFVGYIVTSNVAGVVAWWKYLAGEKHALWEPTRR